MAPSGNPRAVAAMMAMKNIGFPTHVSKPVLKSLIKASENNWEYIETDNYSVLVDAILQAQESQPPNPSSQKEDDAASTEFEHYRTRLKVKRQDEQPSPWRQSSSSSEKRRRIESDCPRESPVSSQPSSSQRTAEVVPPQSSFIKKTTEAGPSQRAELAPPQKNHKEVVASTSAQEKETAEPTSLQTNRRDKRAVSGRSENLTYFKEPKVEPGLGIPPNQGMASCYAPPTGPEDEPRQSDSPQFEVPIAVMHPTHPVAVARKDLASRDDSSVRNAPIHQTNVSQLPVEPHTHKEKEIGKESVPIVACNNRSTQEHAHVQMTSLANVDVASSALGEVKLSLTCSHDRPDFRMPSLEDVFKMVEDRCLRSYKILQPSFSLMNLMKEMCQCVLELGSEPAQDKPESIVNVTSTLDSLKKPGLHGMPGCSSNGSLNLPPMNGHPPNQTFQWNNENGRIGKMKEPSGPAAVNAISNTLVLVHQPQLALGSVRPPYDVNDISKGEERVRIPLVNDFSTEMLPSSFYYIPNNIVYQNAYVNFSLARIGDEDCCSDCFRDCLAAPIPCACARETGGEFAYTPDGLIKKEFLDVCISMNQNPEKHCRFYCKNCPLERTKNEVNPDCCKGHLIRKFVKECWSKCGCSKQCGNRVVQRGITCNLEVFFVGEGKGWGVRTLDELPRGAFVCEYVGEVLTNMELYDRTLQTTGNAKHTYPVLLDADWGTEGVLKDEEALCLDATFYGNVARFVNHRCFIGKNKMQSLELLTLRETMPSSLLPCNNRPDSISWQPSSSGMFSIKSAWECLREHCTKVVWKRLVWFPGRIPKATFCLWLAIRKKLGTQDRLFVTDANTQCLLCGGPQETHHHLFFDCGVSQQIWAKVQQKSDMCVPPVMG